MPGRLLDEVHEVAGHADIIREQIDGVAVPALVLTLAGAPPPTSSGRTDRPPGTLLA